jgi:hypothetical protein
VCCLAVIFDLGDENMFVTKFARVSAVLLVVLAARVLMADSLELADGTILEGDFVGSSNGIIMFNTGDSVEAYMEHQVVGIFLSDGVATAQTLSQTLVSSALTVPAGTKLVIRMSETIDSKRHGAGHKFRGQLEGALVVGGVTVVPRGTMLYGTITSSKSGGRAFGKSEMTMEFTDVMIDDQLYPIATEGLAARSGNESGKTVGRTARAAAIGGLYGGSSSARKGAKIGLGASLLTSGSNLNVPAGTLLDTRLRMALIVN